MNTRDDMGDAMKARPEIFAAVRNCVVQSLALTEAQVQLESRLIDDLGADSLDFADILFSLGDEFDIPLRDSEFSFLVHLDFSSPEVMRDGHLSQDVIARLQSWLPALAALPDRTQVSPRELFSLITIEAICLVVGRRLAALGR